MTYERAKDFADRLPDVVPREEANIDHLDDEMADLLYPGRRPRPYRMGVVFDDFSGDGCERALALARGASAYREIAERGRRRHRAEFETSRANDLRDLVTLVGARPGTDVLVEGRKAPYARELWLPLFFLFVKGD